MASEYRALAGLPGIEDARIFEPEPGGDLRMAAVITERMSTSSRDVDLASSNARAATPELSPRRDAYGRSNPDGAHNLAGRPATQPLTVDDRRPRRLLLRAA